MGGGKSTGLGAPDRDLSLIPPPPSTHYVTSCKSLISLDLNLLVSKIRDWDH